ncbi:MAG TPA: D-alanyl-D-alanine carboxypeptidase family protein [Opitutaceae bacterium]|nr:D-alanyl-D-alanine carboxypeptidase family protein [Opitutaceae bacterium]
MRFSRLFLFGFLPCLPAFLPAAALGAAAATRSRPTRPAPANPGGYKGAIIMDAATGNVLFEDNADLVNPPASMTKLMTFAVLVDKLNTGSLTLQTPVRITPEDAAMGGTEVYLDARETFPVEELIYAMMIQSANDAAHALAHAGAGSTEAFVELMNAKARELGMLHTTFRSPHGLPPGNRKIADGDLTTPRDFALLCRYLLLKTDVLKYTSVRQRPFGSPPRPKPIDMVNHDNLLGKVAGVDGLKTGYTNGAGFCLAATAQRNGRRVIVVAMGGDTAQNRDRKVIELLERGFSLLPPGSPPFAPSAPAGKAGGEVPVTLVPMSASAQPPAAPAPTTPGDASSIKITVPGRK